MISFFFTHSQILFYHVYVSHFHPSVEGYLGCSHFLAIVNMEAMNIAYMCSVGSQILWVYV